MLGLRSEMCCAMHKNCLMGVLLFIYLFGWGSFYLSDPRFSDPSCVFVGLLRGWAMLGRSSPIGNCMRLMIWLAYGRLGSYGFVFEDVFDVWCELWDPPDEQSWSLEFGSFLCGMVSPNNSGGVPGLKDCMQFFLQLKFLYRITALLLLLVDSLIYFFNC